MTHKVLELKFAPAKEQRDRLHYELLIQNKVWNVGLSLIEWAEFQQHWQAIAPYTDSETIPTPIRFNYLKEEKHLAYYCDRVKWSKLGTKAHKCQVGEWIEESSDGRFLATPHIPQLEKLHYLEPAPFELRKDPTFSLTRHFSKQNLTSDDQIIFWQDVDFGSLTAKYIQGQCKTLGNAWKTYKEGKRDRPKYKPLRRSKAVNTLGHYNAEDIRTDGDRLRLPGIGWVTVKGLAKRLKGRTFNPLRICRKPTGWYVQLTVKDESDLPRRYEKPTGVIIGVDAGVADVITEDYGRSVKPIDSGAIAARIVKLQRKASRQWEMNHNNPDWSRANWHKTCAELSKLHEQIARHRASLNHYIADRLVSTATVIVIEDLNLQGMTRASKPKYNPELKRYEQNKRKQKAGLNRKLANSAIGDLYAKLENKASDRHRLVIRVPAFFSSQECSKCGHTEAANRPNDHRGSKFFKCVSCGHESDADHNAAINIRKRGIDLITRVGGCVKGDRLQLPPGKEIEYLEWLRSAIQEYQAFQATEKKGKATKGGNKGRSAQSKRKATDRKAS